MNAHPLVSVICLCYNQKKFVREAVQSVLDQSYKNVEIIIVDDASTDGSKETIQEILREHPSIQSILFEENRGNCKAFNAGWRMAKGDFIIDFSTDDVMDLKRIEKQVDCFSTLDESFGVVFTDSIYIDANGKKIRNHTDYLISKKRITKVPEGDVFVDVLKKYFISTQSMMFKNEILKKLNGYDENLSYEDFDFWIRSSRICNYKYLDEPLTYVRKSIHSKSSTMYEQGDSQLYSTYLICEKTVALCRTKAEIAALINRVSYEFRQSLFSENSNEAKLFMGLLKKLHGWRYHHILLYAVSLLPLPWRAIRNFYHKRLV